MQTKRFRPRKFQRDALAAIKSGLTRSDRGRCIMPCGTGKTLVELWASEALQAKRILLCVPTLSLIKQTLEKWQEQSSRPLDILCVCSDEKIRDSYVRHTSDLGKPVTTDPRRVAHFLSRRSSVPKLVISTYQSLLQIAKSQRRKGCPAFELALADEAHHCAGSADSAAALFVDAKSIRARKRLFFTATPRYFTARSKSRAISGGYDVVSMDDERQFGPEFYSMSFQDAIRKGLLADYRVEIIAVTDAKVRQLVRNNHRLRINQTRIAEARRLALGVGVLKVVRKYSLRKTLCFHRTVASAKQFANSESADSLVSIADYLPSNDKPTGALIVQSIDGTMDARERAQILDTFTNSNHDSKCLLQNCHCLNEGVDVPGIDSVAFFDPKGSAIDIVQAVGRAIRPHGSKISTIILPVFCAQGQDESQVTEGPEFRAVWEVARALKAHDDLVAQWIDDVKDGGATGGGTPKLPEKFHIDLSDTDFDIAKFHPAFVSYAARFKSFDAFAEPQILEELDAHFRLTGRWPSASQGKWRIYNACLRFGCRGVGPGSSIRKLLAKYHRIKTGTAIRFEVGQQIGKRAILKIRAGSKGVPARVLCRCACGNESWVSVSSLRKGHTCCRKCAAPSTPSMFKFKIGQRVGGWKIIKRLSRRGGIYLVRCQCGKTRKIQAAMLSYRPSTIGCKECAIRQIWITRRQSASATPSK